MVFKSYSIHEFVTDKVLKEIIKRINAGVMDLALSTLSKVYRYLYELNLKAFLHEQRLIFKKRNVGQILTFSILISDLDMICC